MRSQIEVVCRFSGARRTARFRVRRWASRHTTLNNRAHRVQMLVRHHIEHAAGRRGRAVNAVLMRMRLRTFRSCPLLRSRTPGCRSPGRACRRRPGRAPDGLPTSCTSSSAPSQRRGSAAPVEACAVHQAIGNRRRGDRRADLIVRPMDRRRVGVARAARLQTRQPAELHVVNGSWVNRTYRRWRWKTGMAVTCRTCCVLVSGGT